MQTNPLKDSIIAALHAFIRQRPGLEYGNYGDAAAYRSEMRSITRDLNHARQLLRQVELSFGITGRDMLRTAAHSRLTIRETDSGIEVDYITGQYFPTEYRRAVAKFCAELLWAYRRDHAMPDGIANKGEWLRHSFRREYGRAIAGRYFS